MYKTIQKIIGFTILFVIIVLFSVGEYGNYLLNLILQGFSEGIVLLSVFDLIPILVVSVPIVLIVMGGYAAYVGYLLVLAILLTGGFFTYAGAALNSAFAEQPVTDVSRYQEFRLSPYLDPEVVNHFPSEIPSDGENIYLFFTIGFRGPYDFQLRMKLPPAQIEKIQDRFRPAAKLKYIPGRDDNSIDDRLRYSINARLHYSDRFHSDEIEDRSYPENDELLALENAHVELVVLENTNGRGRGNSCHYGVAIDSSVSEVIYWTNGL